MTAQDRSLLVGGASFVATCLAILLAFSLLSAAGGNEPAGQFIRNNASADDAELAVGPAGADGDGLGARNGGDTAYTTSSSTPAFTAGPAKTDQGDTNSSSDAANASAEDSSKADSSDSPTTASRGTSTTLRNAALVSTGTSRTTAIRRSSATTTKVSPPTTRKTTTARKTATTRRRTATTRRTTTTPPTTTTTASTTTTAEPTTSTTASTTTTTTAPSGAVNSVEQEIHRLTNELRADPSGPLARQKPMPSCVDEPFYGISVDSATGHPNAVGALSLSEPVSRQMSRPWAVEMDSRDSMVHRSNGSQMEIYGQLGIGIAATGENIAWFSGFGDSEAALTHFEGWRESDTGHYCALVAGTFTHIGVGHHKGTTKSWAVQNFYRQR